MVTYDTNTVDLLVIDQLLEKLKASSHLPIPFAPCVFALDYKTGNYLFWSDGSTCMLNAEQQMDEGVKGLLARIDPSFIECHNKNVFPEIIKVLKTKEEDEDLYFSFNYRLKDKNGRQSTVLQKGTYICSELTDLPLYVVGTCWDISAIKNDDQQVLSIESHDNRTGTLKCNNVLSFNTQKDEVQLTSREKNIIELLLSGKSSKMIADNLSISTATVNNHRQNILRKTNSRNCAELISYSLKNNILS